MLKDQRSGSVWICYIYYLCLDAYAFFSMQRLHWGVFFIGLIRHMRSNVNYLNKVFYWWELRQKSSYTKKELKDVKRDYYILV